MVNNLMLIFFPGQPDQLQMGAKTNDKFTCLLQQSLITLGLVVVDDDDDEKQWIN